MNILAHTHSRQHYNLSRINCLQFQFYPIHWIYSSSCLLLLLLSVLGTWGFRVFDSLTSTFRWFYFIFTRKIYAIIIFDSEIGCFIWVWHLCFWIRFRLFSLVCIRSNGTYSNRRRQKKTPNNRIHGQIDQMKAFRYYQVTKNVKWGF